MREGPEKTSEDTKPKVRLGSSEGYQVHLRRIEGCTKAFEGARPWTHFDFAEGFQVRLWRAEGYRKAAEGSVVRRHATCL